MQWAQKKVWTLLASQTFPIKFAVLCPGGGIGRHAILRGWCEYSRASSNLVLGTEKTPTVRGRGFLFLPYAPIMTDQQNTPKEPLAIKPPKAMTRIAKTTQFFSTGWAASIAFRWFVTPYPFKIPKREIPFEQRFGSPTMFTHENGKRYPVYQIGTGSKNILLIHGWAGRFTQFRVIVEAMEAQYPDLLKEYTITGFNGVSHRGAEGKRTLMPEIASCIVQVAQHLGEVDLALAHSLGCGATMYAVQNLGAPIKRQVLIAPPGRISAMVGLFCDTIGFNRSVHARIVKNMKAKYGEDFDMFSPPELAPFNKIPALVFHDVDDRDTPISLGREVGEKMANGTYIETSGLGHRRILRDSKVIEQIMKWSFNIS